MARRTWAGLPLRLQAFHATLGSVLAGAPKPLSWQSLLSGSLAEKGGRYRFVLIQPKLDYAALQPGGAATDALRAAIARLEFVAAGSARVRITGAVALADEEFATVAQGAVAGLVGSFVLIALWLFLAIRSWRLIIPVLATLVLGLLLTTGFAAAAVGTLNLVSVAFAVLFVGIAVDFAIQFSVRFREMRLHAMDARHALGDTARRVGVQILVAAVATSAGFLAFVPTSFSGVAQLGLIAGLGMLIAFLCTLVFLPAALTLFRPRAEDAEIGFTRLRPVDTAIVRHRRAILAVFGVLAVAGVAGIPFLRFDADPLHTKDPHTEAMATLRDLMADPITTPYSIDALEPDLKQAVATGQRAAGLPLVANTLTLQSLVPEDQAAKLAIIADAANILASTLSSRTPAAPVSPADLRLATRTAAAGLTRATVKLPPESPIALVAADLRALQAAPDAVLVNANGALTRFLPAQLARLRASLGAQPVSVQSIPAAIARDWMLPDGRARVSDHPQARGLGRAGAEPVCRHGERGGPRGGRVGRHDHRHGPHHHGCVPQRGDRCGADDRGHPVRHPAPPARRGPGAGAAAAVVADDRGRVHRAAAAPELRQHHRAAAAARCGRVVQHLFRDELASRRTLPPGIGHGAGGDLLGADDGDGVRLARAIAASGDGEHGGSAADQPGVHAAGHAVLRAGVAGNAAGAGCAGLEKPADLKKGLKRREPYCKSVPRTETCKKLSSRLCRSCSSSSW